MKVRLGFREHWENPNAAASVALNTLVELLGYQVHVEVDSAQLWSDLEKFHPDPETFAPNITNVVQTWAECLTARLQEDSNEVWTEKLLGVVTERGTVVRAHVEVSVRLPSVASAEFEQLLRSCQSRSLALRSEQPGPRRLLNSSS